MHSFIVHLKRMGLSLVGILGDADADPEGSFGVRSGVHQRRGLCPEKK